MYSKETQRELYDLSKSLLRQSGEVPHNHAAQRMDELKKVIVYHEWRYYVMNDPVVSDYEYDMLFKQLEALEDQFPDLKAPDSPTLRVSSDITEEFVSVQHLTPMLSLANSYNEEDLKDFDEQIKKLTGQAKDASIEYCIEPKYDGGTIALVYENDLLIRAATRGNGEMGEEMTNNAKVIRSIPLRASFSKYGIHKVELRGEALIRKDNFDKINKKRGEQGFPLFANPRNAATGGLRTKDPKETSSRGIDAFVYQLGYAVDADGNNILNQFKSHHESILLLGELGFKIPDTDRLVCQNIDEAVAMCHDWQEKRDTYPYEIDGMVLKVNDLLLQEQCGYTSHHPRWAIAFKFKAKQATSRLTGVEFQVGKVGSITPVAKVEPVQLAGVTVSSVSLHNADFISSKDIRIGDTVLVERAGDVIPYIVKPLEELRNGSEEPIVFPHNCPSCGTALVRQEDEAAWRCMNYDHCPAQILQRMIHHVSKDAMDIEGFGKSIVERFYELGWLKNLADIYRLDYDQIAVLEGFGEKSAANMKNAIEKAKGNPLHRLLYSLSIHHLGKKVSKLLAAEIGHVLELRDWTPENFTAIKDIGPVVAQNVISFFSSPDNIALLEEMERLGVNMRQLDEDKKAESAAEGVFAGKSILFTGALSRFTREEAEKAAAAAGATIASGVSSKLSILVVGEKAGSKLEKARKLGTVQIMTEEEFALNLS